jgi:hypothetical protein
MIPEELYKRRRRHNNTPKSLMLIMTNYIVVLVCMSLFTACGKVNTFFWVVMAGMAVYNFFSISRFRDDFNKITIISYAGSMVVLIAVFILFLVKEKC